MTLLKRSTVATVTSTFNKGFLLFNSSIPFLLSTISQKSNEITEKFNMKAHPALWKLHALQASNIKCNAVK